MKKPFFTVVIPTYNRASFILKTIQTVLDQTYRDFEVIVVDDGSTDDTEALVETIVDERVSYFKKNNEERGAARNFGAARARGEYINFFDSDDLMYPHHLETAFQKIKQWHDPEWFHLGYDSKYPEGNIFSTFNDPGDSLSNEILHDNKLSCNGVIIRRDIALLFPFNPERALASSEDWELWIRLVSRYPLHHAGDITTSVVLHDLRSLYTIPPKKIVARDLIMIDHLSNDQQVMNRFGSGFARFKAERFTFFMLKYSQAKDRKKLLFWARKAASTYFSVIFTRRFLASLKNGIL